MSGWKKVAGSPGQLWKSTVPGPLISWLGQAGFTLRVGDTRVVIDPYLSDSLEEKYRGTDKPHIRMMPAPVEIPELEEVDYVLCSHRHTDHMDGQTLRAFAGAHPACRFVVPRAEKEHAISLGLPAHRVITVNAGEQLVLSPEISVKVTSAAHEQIETNERGEHRYLGFILRLPRITIYHSGDTVPFEGLLEQIVDEGIGLALLPVNGRGKGVAGNFTFEEAAELCRRARIPEMVPHHFGMFSFNTLDRETLARNVAETTTPACHVPDVRSGLAYRI